MIGLREKTIRGVFAKMSAQGLNFAMRLGCLMVLGRLLEPRDFGLVGMVTAVTGILNLFRDFGLSTAAVQRASISPEQLSTLFWVNLLVGGVLSAVTVAAAPAISGFYQEPRLTTVALVLATSFLFNAAGVQHWAILQRQMRFVAIATIETIALAASTVVGIIMALSGAGYWSLVGMAVSSPFVSAICLWTYVGWVPGRPGGAVGIRSMLTFGGTITLNSLVVYVAYNLEKVLLGRFWGATAIGIYGRAYQLISIPNENLNTAVAGVAFSALSRLQDDAVRFRSYFLKYYSFIFAITLPVTAGCALFAGDLLLVVLGPKWTDAVPIFRLLSPTIVVLALITPMGWFLFSLGLVRRSLWLALVMAPLVMIGYIIGLPYGPRGVALGYSTMMVLWVVPHIAWSIHGTVISLKDVLSALSRPVLSVLVAAPLAYGAQLLYLQDLNSLLRLLLGGCVLAAAYLFMLMYVLGQKPFYMSLFRTLLRRASSAEEELASA